MSKRKNSQAVKETQIVETTQIEAPVEQEVAPVEQEVTPVEQEVTPVEQEVAPAAPVVAEMEENKKLRKPQILNLLRKRPYSVSMLAILVGISNKNVSSILTYLRKDGNVVHTLPTGEKYLMHHTYSTEVTELFGIR